MSAAVAHRRWRGNPRQYQIEAQRAWSIHHDRDVRPWSWITTTCEISQCLDPECMTVHAPIHIRYPVGTCVYCGEGCEGVDHLLPEPRTGQAERALVARVPACANCNARIGDHPSPSVAERRRVAQLSIEKAGRRLLVRPHRTEEDMVDLGYAMRTVARKNNLEAERVRARLAWPIDPFYDLRAFQSSGIHDPESLGLCDALATPLRPEYRLAAEEAR